MSRVPPLSKLCLKATCGVYAAWTTKTFKGRKQRYLLTYYSIDVFYDTVVNLTRPARIRGSL